MQKDISLRVLPRVAAIENERLRAAAKALGVKVESITALRIVHHSIDARQKQVMVNLTLRAYINEPAPATEFEPVEYPDVKGKPQAVVVGAGPAGLFAALKLIELGVRPIVLERGKDVRARKKDIAQISRHGIVDPNSNYAFGEGGAGAYSDGKLYTRSTKRGDVNKILRVFCQHGASTNILYEAHPHIGTDRLPRVIENMRNTIIRCGGEVHFQTRVTGLLFNNKVEHPPVGAGFIPAREETSPVTPDSTPAHNNADTNLCVSGVTCEDGHEYLGPVILATGHSARDVYHFLYDDGVFMEPKGIAIGLRLEHPSHLIDQIFYHSPKGRGDYLPAAEYRLSCQQAGRGVYSFCMCPGGFVIPAASGPDQLVVNGMSPAARNSRWSNSGIVVELRPEDLSEPSLSALLQPKQCSNRVENEFYPQSSDNLADDKSILNGICGHLADDKSVHNGTNGRHFDYKSVQNGTNGHHADDNSCRGGFYTRPRIPQPCANTTTYEHLATLSTSPQEIFSHPLRMMFLQEALERECFLRAGKTQHAPAQRMTDFVSGRLSDSLPTTSYQAGVVSSPLHEWLPAFLRSRLRAALLLFSERYRGFLTREATLLAIETRTSAPVRITRNRQSLEAFLAQSSLRYGYSSSNLAHPSSNLGSSSSTFGYSSSELESSSSPLDSPSSNLGHSHSIPEPSSFPLDTPSSDFAHSPSNLAQSPSLLAGLYPCGEGAGYAGGIVSAAIDGERCAQALAARLLL